MDGACTSGPQAGRCRVGRGALAAAGPLFHVWPSAHVASPVPPPQVVVFVGDLSYADCYQSNGSLGPELLYNDTSRQHKSHGQDAAGGGSFGPRW